MKSLHLVGYLFKKKSTNISQTDTVDVILILRAVNVTVSACGPNFYYFKFVVLYFLQSATVEP